MHRFLFAGRRRAPHMRVVVLAICAAFGSQGLQAQGAARIGRVMSATGTVSLQGPGASAVLVGTDAEFQAGDVIETQANSAAALRYSDGTQVQLGPRTRMTVSAFVIKPDQPTEERFALKLLTGAMRVITGAIASRRPDNARFSTNTATIGIRGTDFVMRLCEADCIVSDDPMVARVDGDLVGRLGGLAGGVSAVDARGRWRALSLSAPLREGDRVFTGNTGIAIVVLRDDTRIALDPGSQLWIRAFQYDEAAPQRGRIALELVEGKAQVSTGKLAKQHPEKFAFRAGESAVRVHGTIFGAVVKALSNAGSNAANAAQDAAAEVQRNAQAAADAAAAAARAAAAAARAAEVAARAAADAAATAAAVTAAQAQRNAESAAQRSRQTASQANQAAQNTAQTAQQTLQQVTQQAQTAAQQADAALKTAIDPLLREMTAQMAALRANPPTTQAAANAAADQVRKLSERFTAALAQRQVLYRAQTGLPIPLENLGLFTVLRLHFLAYCGLSMDTEFTAAALGVLTPSRGFIAIVESEIAAIQQSPELTQAVGLAGLSRSDLDRGRDIARIGFAAPVLSFLAEETGPYIDQRADAAVQAFAAEAQRSAQAAVDAAARAAAATAAAAAIAAAEALRNAQNAEAAAQAQPVGRAVGSVARYFNAVASLVIDFSREIPEIVAPRIREAGQRTEQGLAPTLENVLSNAPSTLGKASRDVVQAIGVGADAVNAAVGDATTPLLRELAGKRQSAKPQPQDTQTENRSAVRDRENESTGAQFAVADGAISVGAQDRPTVRVARGEMLDTSQRGQWVKARGGATYAAPLLATVQVDPRQLFGADAGARGKSAEAGTYVHVRDGAVSLAQNGQEVTLAQGETGFANAAGGSPVKVQNGVRVAGAAALGPDRIAAAVESCLRDSGAPVSAQAAPGRAAAPPAAERSNLANARPGTDLAQRFEIAQPTGQSGQKQGGAGSGRNLGTGENRSAVLVDQARGDGPKSGSAIEGVANRVTGSDADTFGGGRANARGGGQMTQGGGLGNVTGSSRNSKVSSSDDEVTGDVQGDGERFIIGVTDDATAGAREDRYAQMAGSDHYDATKDMTDGQRADYWRGERDRQQSGSDRPTGDDNFTGGGNGLPVFLSRGQFGIAIRGVERAVGAKLGAAGGAKDGRGDQTVGGGGGGGVMMQRGQQLGVESGSNSTGTLNLDAGLSINQLVNPGVR